jgi:acyl carrier protein
VLHGVVARTLQIRPEQLQPDRNLSDYGADSIISVDLVAAIGAQFGITLKPTILFSHPTITRLAAHLAAHHGLRAPTPTPLRDAPQPSAAVAPDEPSGGWCLACECLGGRYRRYWPVRALPRRRHGR